MIHAACQPTSVDDAIAGGWSELFVCLCGASSMCRVAYSLTTTEQQQPAEADKGRSSMPFYVKCLGIP